MPIGSFHATLNGIPVVCAGGNAGPNSSSVISVAPWIMTVAASTMDREFPAYVHLGNGQKLKGQSLSTAGLSPNTSYALIISGEATAANSNSSNDAVLCNPGSLDPAKVEGKIVACEAGGVYSPRKREVVKEAGGAVMQSERTEIYPAQHFLPAVDVGPAGNVSLRKYYDSTPSPTAYITRPRTELGVKA
ncbi:macromolecule glycosylation [Asimina triloba]